MAERHPFPSTRKPIVLIEHTARTGGRAASPSPCRVSGDFSGDPAVSSAVESEVELTGAAPIEQLRALVDHVDRIAEIPTRYASERRCSFARPRPPSRPPMPDHRPLT
jgi:hypothetical protein